MKRVLLTCVGLRDPIPEGEGARGEGAIVTLCRKLQPGALLLLPTEGAVTADGERRSSTLDRAKLTEEWLREAGFEESVLVIHSRPLRVADPRDYQQLLPEMRKACEEFLSGVDRTQVECLVNLSSGTPQQQACWLLLASSGFLPNPRLYTVADPNYVEEDRRVQPVVLEFIEEELLVARAAGAVRDALFGLASAYVRRLAEITVYPERREAARNVVTLLDAYHEWDLCLFEEAYDRLHRLRDATRGMVQWEELRGDLRLQMQVLGRLRDTRVMDRQLALQDLYWNAQRCFLRRAYVDALARTWRILEEVVYWALERNGVNPRNPARSTPERLALLESQGVDDGPVTVSRGMRLVRELGDKAWCTWVEEPLTGAESFGQCVGDALDCLRHRRNDSIAAHGLAPVDRGTAELGLRLARNALKRIVGVDVSNYPFRHAVLTRLAEALPRVLGG